METQDLATSLWRTTDGVPWLQIECRSLVPPVPDLCPLPIPAGLVAPLTPSVPPSGHVPPSSVTTKLSHLICCLAGAQFPISPEHLSGTPQGHQVNYVADFP